MPHKPFWGRGVALSARPVPTIPTFGQRYGHPDVIYVPIEDMPASETPLVWLRGASDPRLREFVRAAHEIVRREAGRDADLRRA